MALPSSLGTHVSDRGRSLTSLSSRLVPAGRQHDSDSRDVGIASSEGNAAHRTSFSGGVRVAEGFCSHQSRGLGRAVVLERFHDESAKSTRRVRLRLRMASPRLGAIVAIRLGYLACELASPDRAWSAMARVGFAGALLE